jgi:flagellar hook-associated protein FlgK
MSNYSIGLSGLDAAKRALDVIGNNIANAATDGYHRQRINLTPAYTSQVGKVVYGGGVDIQSVTRMIDSLLEQEILRQQSSLEYVSQEYTTLRTIETSFGELSSEEGGLNAAMDRFFTSLQDLSAHPGDVIWQNQIVTDAASMAAQFRSMGEFLNALDARIELEADSIVDTVNALVTYIAELNDKIEALEMKGTNANSMQDQRDQGISELSELIGVQIMNRPYGVVDVNIGGIPLVMGAQSYELELGYDSNTNMGISIVGSNNYITTIDGGKIGGLLSLKNTVVSDIRTDLNSLAASVILQINQYHVQGVGSAGSFDSLTGWTNPTEDLSDFTNVTSGNLYVRVTNTTTGEITRTQIAIDPATDTLSDVATDITAIAGLTASVNSSNQLSIFAGAGYKYDFLPAVLSEPTASTLADADPPAMTASGVYTDTANDTFTCTVVGDGDVGNGTLQLTVTDGAAGVIATVNIGAGYAAGDKIQIGDTGIEIALSTGTLVDGDTYDVDVFGNTDAAGLLSAIGINAFFVGDSAVNMGVSSVISSDPRMVATSLGADMTDNVNVARMVNIQSNTVAGLDNLTVGNFYQRMTTEIGQQLSLKQLSLENSEIMLLNLNNQQGEISGVDINNEAAQMLVFEQMFQAMAKYMNTINESITALMNIL